MWLRNCATNTGHWLRSRDPPCLPLFETMTTITTVELSVSPLPRPPPPYEEWRKYWTDHLSTYDIILNAERHADEQVQANPSNQEAKDNVMFARVAGYLLIELFNRRVVLSEAPCASLVKQIESTSREGGPAHEVVFGVGKWHCDHLLRMCTFDFFPMSFSSSVSSQIGHPSRGTQHPPTLRVPPSKRRRI
jgi:hypothetical protein